MDEDRLYKLQQGMTKPNVQIMTGWLDYGKRSAYRPVIVLPDIDHTERRSHFLFHSLQQLQNYCESRSQRAPTGEIVQIWKEAKRDYSALIAPACSPTSPQRWHQDKIPPVFVGHTEMILIPTTAYSHISRRCCQATFTRAQTSFH